MSTLAQEKPAKRKPAQPKPAKPKPAKPKLAKPKQVKPKQAEPKPAKSEPAQPKQACVLEPIPAYHVSQVWGLVHDLAETAAGESGEYSVEELYRDTVAGHAHLVVIWNGAEIQAAMFVAFFDMANGKVGNVYALAGERLEDWLGLMPDLEAFCKSQGASRLEIISREAWKRLLPDYDVKSIVLSKDL